jgi:aconitate hydratase
LVVAFALVGRIDWDPDNEPIGVDADGRKVYLKDIWPSKLEIDEAVRASIDSAMYQSVYRNIYAGDERWNSLPTVSSARFQWDSMSTYVREPPYFVDFDGSGSVEMVDVIGARVLAMLGDSITTDHISPAGSIRSDSPAGRFLKGRGVAPKDFNSYGSRRGNHEVMIRGTFANNRIRNRLADGIEGGVTCFLPTGEVTSIYDAAMRYKAAGVPLAVVAGKEYGSGSSRDWAAKGPALLGVKLVLAESFERIHRSNLIGMGILPIEFFPGQSAGSLGLSGKEILDVLDIRKFFVGQFDSRGVIRIMVYPPGQRSFSFEARLRVDTPQDHQYIRHGGILPYVAQQILRGRSPIANKPGAISALSQVEVGKKGKDLDVQIGSEQSFPASDAPAY